MELVQRVSKTDLMRNFRQVTSTVQRGRMAVVESGGEPNEMLEQMIAAGCRSPVSKPDSLLTS
jgi:hypothetical protein